MRCHFCQSENPNSFQRCGECGGPMFLAVLKEISEATALASHYLFAQGATLGRHYDNSIVLLDHSISRYHARIDCANGKFFIQDLSSSNGVFVNEVQVRRREIKDFDRIGLGKIMLLFRVSNLATGEREDRAQTQERFLEAIKDIGQGAKSAMLSNRVLEIAAEFAVNLTRAERAIIFLYDKSLELRPAVFYNLVKPELERDEFEVSRSAIAEAERTGEMLMQEQMLDDLRYSANQSIQALRLNTIICLPLKSPHAVEISKPQETRASGRYVKGVLFGMLYLDSRRPLKGLPQHRKTMLQVLADQTSLAIENAILQKEAAEKQKLKNQIRAAKDVQQRLFPAPMFSHARFEMAFHYAAAQQIGGDYLAFQPLSETRFLFAIGDVVGKGLPAGLVVMTIHGGLYSEITHQQDALSLMRKLDQLVYEYAEGKVFVTFFIGILEVEKMSLEFCSAGHNPPLLHRRATGEWLELRSAGVPLGVDPETDRTMATMQLRDGDLITFYTDGITEARSANRKQFGVAGLKRVLNNWLTAKARDQAPLSALVKTLVERLRHFTDNRPFEDDTTLMAVEIKS